jgi:hypothetical protein
MFYVQYTPVHPEGYPKFFKDRRKSLTDPFLSRMSIGSAYTKFATRAEAEELVDAYHDLVNAPGGGAGTRYELKAEVIER